MKKVLTATAISVAVMLVVLPLAYGQGAPPPQAEKVFEGQLTKVDATAKSISVKGAGDMEMTFEYTDATQVAGVANIQGLAGKTGAELKVTYRDAAGGKRTATKIEAIAEKR
jgi:hypothetical protein